MGLFGSCIGNYLSGNLGDDGTTPLQTVDRNRTTCSNESFELVSASSASNHHEIICVQFNYLEADEVQGGRLLVVDFEG